MHVTYAQQDITPVVPCPMDGYGRREATGVHDNITVRCVLISDGEGQLLRQLCLCVADVFFLEPSLAKEARQAIASRTGLPKDAVHVAAIHTHSGPKVSKLADPGCPPDPSFIEALLDAMASSVERCRAQWDGQGNATARLGTCDLSGLFTNRNGADAGCDTTGTVLSFTSADGSQRIDILHVACHPTVLHGENHLLSTDYVGALREKYESLTGSHAIVLVGDAGDSSTRFTRRGEGFDEVERIGGEIARRFAAATLQTASIAVGGTREVPVRLDYVSAEDETLLSARRMLTGLLKDPAAAKASGIAAREDDLRQMLGMVEAKLAIPQICLDATATLVDLGCVRLALVPSEVVFSFGEQLRDASPVPVLVCGYFDGYLGYAVDRSEYGRFFESYITVFPKGAADEWFSRMAAALLS